MSRDLLIDAIGMLDDDIIEEKIVRKKKWNVFIPAIGGTVVAAAIIVVILGLNGDADLIKPSNNYPQKHVSMVDTEETLEWDADTWSRSIDACRYVEANLNGTKYRTCRLATRHKNVGEIIGTVDMTGQDLFSLEIHEVKAQAYKIDGISSNCAIAIRFNDNDEYAFTYMNTEYTPETLQDLINDLDFKNNVSFGVVIDEQAPDVIAFEGMSEDKIWELLLSDTSILNEPFKEAGSTVMSVCVYCEVLYGIDSIPKTLSVTEDGYLWTNLMETGKYFYIGKNRVEEFKKYVVNNCEGYIYIYDEITGILDGNIEE